MDTMEAIFKRRSIRKYIAGKKVTREQIEKLLSAAMMAPTARNIQEWEFLVVEEPATLKAIMGVHPYAAALATAPAAIIVCANTDIDAGKTYWRGDCGAATQNILLAATALGLGTLWMGLECAPERAENIKKLFNLPKNIEPFALLALGYAGEEKGEVNRFDAKKIHYEKWQ